MLQEPQQTLLRDGGHHPAVVLGRVPVGTFTCVVLNDAELLEQVPAEPHDRRVVAAVTEERLVRFL